MSLNDLLSTSPKNSRPSPYSLTPPPVATLSGRREFAKRWEGSGGYENTCTSAWDNDYRVGMTRRIRTRRNFYRAPRHGVPQKVVAFMKLCIVALNNAGFPSSPLLPSLSPFLPLFLVTCDRERYEDIGKDKSVEEGRERGQGEFAESRIRKFCGSKAHARNPTPRSSETHSTWGGNEKWKRSRDNDRAAEGRGRGCVDRGVGELNILNSKNVVTPLLYLCVRNVYVCSFIRNTLYTAYHILSRPTGTRIPVKHSVARYMSAFM